MNRMKLGEILSVKHGWAFKGEYFAEDGEQSILTPGNFFEKGGFKPNNGKERYYTGTYPKEYLCHKGDLIVAMTQQAEGLLGSTALVPENNKYLHNQRIGLITCDEKRLNKLFAYYLFMTKSVREQLERSSSGTKVKHTSPEKIYDVEVEIPDVISQQKIANLLWAIDEKIANNNAINDNLEQQAKLLYDYWFTQFDFPDENGEPYRSSGGKMVWNEQLKRTIPDGWTTNPLSDIFTFKSGYSFSSDLYEVSGKYKLLTIKNVQNNGINLNVDNYINVLPDNVPDYCLLKAQDILMSLTGNVGRVGIMYADNCLLNQRVALAEPVNINQRVFVYFLLKSDIIHKQYEMIANGSSQQNLSPIEAEKVIIAYNPEVATKFSTLCNEYLNTIVSNLAENQELINIRDWLLPILMNGQATISD